MIPFQLRSVGIVTYIDSAAWVISFTRKLMLNLAIWLLDGMDKTGKLLVLLFKIVNMQNGAYKCNYFK